VLSNSFPEHSLAHFSDVQRISGNYSSVLVIIVARKIHRKSTIKCFGVNPTLLGSETCCLSTDLLGMSFDLF
jgi:hypothetical protein